MEDHNKSQESKLLVDLVVGTSGEHEIGYEEESSFDVDSAQGEDFVEKPYYKDAESINSANEDMDDAIEEMDTTADEDIAREDGNAPDAEDDTYDLFKLFKVSLSRPEGNVYKIEEAKNLVLPIPVPGDDYPLWGICLHCLLAEGPTKCKISRKQGNDIDHLRRVIPQLQDTSNVLDMSRIKGFQNVRMVYKYKENTNIGAALGATSRPIDKKRLDPLVKYQQAAVEFTVRHGLPSSILQSAQFKNLAYAARRLEETHERSIDRDKAEEIAQSMYDDELKATLEALERGEGFFLIHDCWDWSPKHHFLALAMQFIEHTPSGRLKLWRLPLYFRAGERYDFSDDDLEELLVAEDTEDEQRVKTFASAADILVHVRKMMRHHRLSFNKLIAAIGDGAAAPARKTSAQITELSSFELFASDDVLDTLDWNALTNKCLAHDFGLAVNYSLGMSQPKNKKTTKIPKPASDRVLDRLAAVRSLVLTMSDAKMLAQLQAHSRKVGNQLMAMNVDMEVRWLSTWKTLGQFISNFEILESFCKGHSECADHFRKVFRSFRKQDYLHLEAVLQPFMLATVALEHDKPLAAFSLPLIYFILAKYGTVVKDGILVDDAPSLSIDEMKHKPELYKFELRDGSWVSVKDLRPSAVELLTVLQAHVKYRLLAKRENANAIELLATFCDPLLHTSFPFICGERKYPSLRGEIIKKLKRLVTDVGNSPHPETTPPATIESNTGDAVWMVAVRSEITPFQKELESFEAISTAMFWGNEGKATFKSLLATIESWDPLGFWGEASNQQAYPTFFRANKVTLGCPTTSNLVDSLFSSAGDTLTDCHRRLLVNPDYLQSQTLLRFILARKERAQQKARREEQGGAKKREQLPAGMSTGAKKAKAA